MTTSTMTRLRPPQWRLLNGLYFMGTPLATTGWYGLAHQLQRQNVSWERLVALHKAELVTVRLGELEVPTHCLDIGRDAGHSTVHLAGAGLRLVVETAPNNVILALGRRRNRATETRRLMVEAGVDGDVVRGMGEAGLVEAVLGDAVVSLDIFRRIPPDLPLRLTRKGCTYYPR